jgi:hypothetical protein
MASSWSRALLDCGAHAKKHALAPKLDLKRRAEAGFERSMGMVVQVLSGVQQGCVRGGLGVRRSRGRGGPWRKSRLALHAVTVSD